METPPERAKADSLEWYQAEDWEECDPNPEKGIMRNWKARWKEETGRELNND
jgi:hypothetical protein